MFTCRSACISCNADGITGKNLLTFIGRHLGEMAIADLIIPMPENNITPGTSILANLLDIAVKHRENFFILGFKVKTAVKGRLTRERIFPISVMGCYFNMLQGVGNTEIALYPVIPIFLPLTT